MTSWVARSGGGGGRAVELLSTAPLAAPQSAELLFCRLGRAGQLLTALCSHPAWLSLYVSPLARQADRQRSVEQDPSPQAGVVLDLLFSRADQTLLLPPGLTYYNAEQPSRAALYGLLRPQHGEEEALSLRLEALVLEA